MGVEANFWENNFLEEHGEKGHLWKKWLFGKISEPIREKMRGLVLWQVWLGVILTSILRKMRIVP